MLIGLEAVTAATARLTLRWLAVALALAAAVAALVVAGPAAAQGHAGRERVRPCAASHSGDIDRTLSEKAPPIRPYIPDVGSLNLVAWRRCFCK